MCWPVLIIAIGLALTLAGLARSICFDPPVVAFDMAAHADLLNEVALRRSRGDKTTPIIRKKIEWSKSGVGLLVAGTALQLAGTVCQVFLLACRF